MSGTVYIVDDDQGVRTGLTQALGTHGYHALTFPTADEFIARYTPGGPACLVLDLVMPGTHGLQLLDRIDPDDPIRIIVLTGYADIPTAV
ncbi:MAG: response regulator transcription factor, partial [Phycisphaerales bacterium JB040]